MSAHRRDAIVISDDDGDDSMFGTIADQHNDIASSSSSSTPCKSDFASSPSSRPTNSAPRNRDSHSAAAASSSSSSSSSRHHVASLASFMQSLADADHVTRTSNDAEIARQMQHEPMTSSSSSSSSYAQPSYNTRIRRATVSNGNSSRMDDGHDENDDDDDSKMNGDDNIAAASSSSSSRTTKPAPRKRKVPPPAAASSSYRTNGDSQSSAPASSSSSSSSSSSLSAFPTATVPVSAMHPSFKDRFAVAMSNIRVRSNVNTNNDAIDTQPYRRGELRREDSAADIVAAASSLSSISRSDDAVTSTRGTIKQIELINFLSHRKFIIKLNPNVNFIYGPNGSGKSAILHAIQIAFGGRAADTNRGSSMKQLIHYGKSEAIIRVTINNEGDDNAFKHDLYGDDITIERVLKMTGASSIRMIGSCINPATNKVYTNKYAGPDLRDMCGDFNIRVSNPCIIMTQDVSKRFLTSSNPALKYEFFLEATQLEQLREGLSVGRVDVAAMGATLAIQSSRLPDISTKLNKLEQDEKLAQDAKNIEEDVKMLQSKMIWREVKDLEIKFDEMDAKHKSLQSDIDRIDAAHKSLIADNPDNAASLSSIEAHKAEMERCDALKNDCARNVEDANRAIMKVRQDQKTHTGKIHTLKDKRRELKLKLDKNLKDIDNIAELNGRDTRVADESRAKRKDELIESRKRNERDVSDAVENIAHLHDHDIINREAESTLNSECRAIANRVNQIKDKLRPIEASQSRSSVSSSSSSAAASSSSSLVQHNPAFGVYTQQIWDAMQRRKGEFAHLPIGPLGHYVTIKPEHQQRWMHSITQCLTLKNMCTYTCYNSADQHVLQDIIDVIWKRNNDNRTYKPMMLTFKYRDRFNVIRPSVDFPLVMDVIDIPNDVAFNAIVMLCNIERWALHDSIDNAEIAIRPFRSKCDGSNEYVIGSIAMNGSKVMIRGASLEGASLSVAATENAMFTVNRAGLISYYHNSIRIAQGEFDDMQRKLDDAAKKMDGTKREIDKWNRKKKECQQSISRIDDDVDQLDIDQAQAQRNEDIDDSQQQSNVISITNNMAECNSDIADLESPSSSAIYGERIKALKSDVADATAKFDTNQKLSEVEAKSIESIVVSMAKLKAHINKILSKKISTTSEHRKLEVEFAALSTRLESTTERAIASGPVVDIGSGDTMMKISAAHTAKMALLVEKRKRAPIDVDKVKVQIKKEGIAYVNTQMNMAEALNNKKKLDALSLVNFRRLVGFRKHVGSSASYKFNDILSQRGGSGELVFDHPKRQLNVVVNPNVLDVNRQDTASTVALSGGERSLTTISFVMAIGEQIECPFRAIDEFDVFMDSVNRRLSLDLLIDIAQQRKDRQCIFLSPLDISDVAANKYLTIHKLNDVDRNQIMIDHERQRGGEDMEEE